MRYYVVWVDGTRYGPADVTTLGQWAREGRVTAQTILEEEGTGRRMHAQQVLGAVGPMFAPAPPPHGGGQRWDQPWASPQSSSYPSAHHSYGMPMLNLDGDRLVRSAWMWGFFGILCCPVVGAGIGTIQAVRARGHGARSANAALGFNLVVLILGVLGGFALISNPLWWMFL